MKCDTAFVEIFEQFAIYYDYEDDESVMNYRLVTTKGIS